VEIYEFTPGFVHAKVYTSDGEKAVVGTINLDFRSLYHHFECGAFLYKNKTVADVEEDFQKTLGQCQKITRQTCKAYPFYQKLAGRGLRLIAPLM
jgi:cardiolipin synthase